MKRPLLGALYFLVSFVSAGCSQAPYYKESEFVLGTIVEITCQDKNAIREAFAAIKRIERIANKFDSASEVSLLNSQGQLTPSNELLDLLKESIKFYKLSNGAFDITVDPIASLWKSKIKDSQETKSNLDLPKPSEIKNRLRLVGSNKILLNEKKPFVKLSKTGMSVDLGGIAKGYAVDCARRRLTELGIKSALVNAGGNLYCLGKKYNAKWRIGIRDPRKPEDVLFNLSLENQAAATSGDYQQYFFHNRKRYSHIIDPRTGYPVDNGVISVTIIADKATTADALSTAVFVLGKEKGLALLENLGKIGSKIIEEK